MQRSYPVKPTVKAMILGLAILLPAYTGYTAAAAMDNKMDNHFTSKLNNESKQNGSEGFYLVRDSEWAEPGCIMDKGKDKINPGESTVLKIKNGCKWGVVKYKVFKESNKEDMGFLAHSFHDGNFSIDVTSTCIGSECHFYDLNPEQKRKK